jgi:ubiquinone/menaquinone biosynthesis C-methylase UbiE
MDDTARQREQLAKEYQLRFAADREYRNAVWRVLTAEFFQQFVPRDGTVVDVGSGWGEFINNITAAKKVAIDLNPDAAERVNADVRLLGQDCSMPWPVDEATVDCVFTSNFLEHLPNKSAVEATLAQARGALRIGGRLVCMGPNIRYLDGEYWDFWDHYVALSDSSLSEVLQLTGFTIERCVPRFLPFRMSGRRKSPLPFVRWYVRLPFIWPIFGKQFLVVARKPTGV